VDPPKTVTVAVTSDKGLCGGLNSNITKYTRTLLKLYQGEECGRVAVPCLNATLLTANAGCMRVYVLCGLAATCTSSLLVVANSKSSNLAVVASTRPPCAHTHDAA
jgi:hypothetical protein